MNNEAAGTVATEDKAEILLEVANLKKHFPVGRGLLAKPEILKAVDDVSFSVHRGETLSLVGESGCGKSTTGKVIIQLLKATSGSIKLEGTELTTLSRHDLRRLRKNVQMVFQDPYASLNPRWTVEQTLLEPMKAFQIGSKAERKERVAALLESVGLDPSSAKKYPHEFSGGQRQRIGIARALVLNPKLVIADEPVSALDISIQAQVLNLMQDVQQAFNLTYLFISHDLAVVEHISDRVAVMYLGRLVEIAGKRDLFSNPSHPYTEALLSASPRVDGSFSKKRIILVGDVPSPVNPPSGCAFRTRCWRAQEICKREAPELKDIGNRHQVACHFRATKVV